MENAEKTENTVEIETKKERENQEGKPPRIKNVSVMIGGRKVPLRLTTRGAIRIEEDMEMDPEELRQALNTSRKNTRLLIKALVILGNEGLRLAGGKADLTEDTVADAIPPNMEEMVLYRVAALAAVTKGLWMETDTSFDEKQDVVLNEILKKNTD